ncbi:uncharacterized protein F5Z01DRAFT_691279 [Emericellopsis atlantica]|uniref:Uncharacterized protein n=1 Tax=Emericellopsis atlantica TaxID=2614577 RepID=A0A9P7ZI12_9HYPO|nr:uncharacterized protein F5Z01DRAFT_691279 [Emericellopsis atlantica]KAG9252111.1 hypothetical protein F5Z01DRAFT_691279 [Emericellopsis atlantica]
MTQQGDITNCFTGKASVPSGSAPPPSSSAGPDRRTSATSQRPKGTESKPALKKRSHTGAVVPKPKKQRTSQDIRSFMGASIHQGQTTPPTPQDVETTEEAEIEPNPESKDRTATKIEEKFAALVVDGALQTQRSGDDENEVPEEQVDTNTSARDETTTRTSICSSAGATKDDNWSEALLSAFELASHEDSLRQFFWQCQTDIEWRGSRDPTCLPELLTSENQWVSVDKALDVEWAAFCDKISALSEGHVQPATMTKPSGRRASVLTVNWHYPTWRTRKAHFGCVLDSTNPSMRAQSKRYFLMDSVRTQNRVPLREPFVNSGVKWAQTYANWPEIEEACLQLNRWLNQSSKVILTVGKENFDSLEGIVDTRGLEVIEIKSKNLQGPLVFGSRPSFKILKCQETQIIRHVVFASHHSQHFYYPLVQDNVRAFHDLLWNGVAELAGLQPDQNHMAYFTRQGRCKTNSPHFQWKGSLLDVALNLRHVEKTSGVLMSENVVRKIFASVINKNPQWGGMKDETGSFLKFIIKEWSRKAAEVRKDPEWRKTVAYEAMYNSHMDNLTRPKDPEKTKVATLKRAAKRESPEWQASAVAKKAEIARQRGSQLPRGKDSQKIAAIKRTKQYNDLVAMTEDQAKAKWGPQAKLAREKALDLDNLAQNKARWRSWQRSHVVWWAEYQHGLHYEGDRSEGRDAFDHAGEEHPQLRLVGIFTQEEKDGFVHDDGLTEEDRAAIDEKVEAVVPVDCEL